MKLYLLCIKSHCEVPDYENEVMAKSKSDALKKFKEQCKYLNEYDDNTLLNYIGCVSFPYNLSC